MATIGKQVFAFEYFGPAPHKEAISGWLVYNFEREMARQGVPCAAWRLTAVNQSYGVCPTYPRLLAVPSTMTDEDLIKGAAFRSKGRLPALSWLNPRNLASITRCSQPRVGLAGKRCAEDEALIQAILQVNPTNNKQLHILDARPRRNAVANQAKGLGVESDNIYSCAEITFLNIHNIHVMRESLRKVKDMCCPTVQSHLWHFTLESTHWLKHVKTVMAGAIRTADLVEKVKGFLKLSQKDKGIKEK